uniref:Uncharacterized protein n=1 Tax=Cacopsylla melanoneura TaxID=428564 RepID=A0A8D9EXG7_9HEMI
MSKSRSSSHGSVVTTLALHTGYPGSIPGGDIKFATVVGCSGAHSSRDVGPAGYASVVSGGTGTRSVTIHLGSARNHGLTFYCLNRCNYLILLLFLPINSQVFIHCSFISQVKSFSLPFLVTFKVVIIFSALFPIYPVKYFFLPLPNYSKFINS